MNTKNTCGTPSKEQMLSIGAYDTHSKKWMPSIQPGDETPCHKCGKVVSVKWNYCSNCGEPIKKNPAS